MDLMVITSRPRNKESQDISHKSVRASALEVPDERYADVSSTVGLVRVRIIGQKCRWWRNKEEGEEEKEKATHSKIFTDEIGPKLQERPKEHHQRIHLSVHKNNQKRYSTSR